MNHQRIWLVIRQDVPCSHSNGEFPTARHYTEVRATAPSLAPMQLTAQNIYGLLIRSRLLSLQDSKAMYDRWLAEAKDGGISDANRFTQWMIGNGYVTE